MRRLRNLLLYSPGLALFVAGIVMLLTVPFVHASQCPCPPGGVCSCPSEGPQYNWGGPILLTASALYSSSVFIVLRIARGWFENWPRPVQ